jgi:hypothetical protein
LNPVRKTLDYPWLASYVEKVYVPGSDGGDRQVRCHDEEGTVPTEAPTFPWPNGPGRLLILRKLLYFSPVAQPAAWDAYKRL